MKTNSKYLKSLKSNQLGFSLIEIMIALVIGVIILTGLIAVFDTSSRLNRTQNGLARIQENGRYALSLMKQEIEQTGYQYCMGESNNGFNAATLQPPKLAWNIAVVPFLSGFNAIPTPFSFDPSFLLHGHDCNGTTCTPALNSLGSDTSTTIPASGTADGDRIAGTDVLTIRYLRGQGREVATVLGNTITFTNWAANNPPVSFPATGQVLVVDCAESGDVPPTLLNIVTNGANTLQVFPNPPVGLSNNTLSKVFNFQTDFVTKSYYVANDVIDGRSIPTLYSVDNGVINAMVQGVDAFDVLYGVRNNLGGIQYFNAAGVDAMAANCMANPIVNPGQPALINMANCGWRSVVTIELHLLLNTIYNSTDNVNEQFRYSQYGNGFSDQSDITSGIEHYNMHRREFFTAITLKNVMH